jgi:hypothetical protein
VPIEEEEEEEEEGVVVTKLKITQFSSLSCHCLSFTSLAACSQTLSTKIYILPTRRAKLWSTL